MDGCRQAHPRIVPGLKLTEKEKERNPKEKGNCERKTGQSYSNFSRVETLGNKEAYLK